MPARLFTTILSLGIVNLVVTATAFAASPVPRGPAGTGDLSGGGNGIYERMYESYIREPRDLPAFKEILAPMFENLARKSDAEHARAAKAGESETKAGFSLFFGKKWFFVPTELQAINEKALGVNMTAQRTQQLAFQKDRSIWVNSLIFDRMGKRDQATLIMHEMLMSVYLMRFKTISDICRMSVLERPEETGCAGSDQELTDRIFPPEPVRPLNETDYEHIRHATDWMMNNAAATSPEAMRRYLEAENFDRRFFRTRPVAPADDKLKTNGQEILAALNRARYGRRLPRTCETSDEKAVACRATTEETKLSVTFPGAPRTFELPAVSYEIAGEGWKISDVALLPDEVELSGNVDPVTGEMVYASALIPAVRLSTAMLGETRYAVVLYFRKGADDHAQAPRFELTAMAVRPMVLVETNPSARERICVMENLDEDRFDERTLVMPAPRETFSTFQRAILKTYGVMANCFH